jgi:cyanophycin synthetase
MAPSKRTGQGVRVVELRVLDGPNLYFTRPAVKLTLDMAGFRAATEERAVRLASGAGMSGRRPDPGGPSTNQRMRFVVRLASHVTRSLAAASGTGLAVRARRGPEPGLVVVAFPWRRRTAAEAFGREVPDLLAAMLSSRRSFGRLLDEASTRLARVEPGPPPVVADPAIPVIAVTGTNGKTTTVRLLAHLVRAAGRTVAYSSTDGVYFQERLVEAGDYSGFGGAATALAQPGVDVAILETARGGILLRGIGTLHNDVAVVTNVSADHMGLLGINTLDQLAEVKSTITRITRPDGWDVLNADDPRVLAMRRTIRGQPWVFSLDEDHPAIRAALEEGGRATTVVDRNLTLLSPGGAVDFLLPLEDIPITLAGISSHNIANAMAASAAALGIGLPREAVIRGLRTFSLDPKKNPGRTNVFEYEGRVVVVDYAHNEAGMAGLVQTCRGLRRPGGEIWIAFSSAGDRTDEIVHGLGYLAARGADHVVIFELLDYLRGRDRQDLLARLRTGAVDGGAPAADMPVVPDPLSALALMLERARPGDVVAVTALTQREEIFSWLQAAGAVDVVPRRIRQLVRRARGRPA